MSTFDIPLRLQSAHQVREIEHRLHEIVPWLRNSDSPYFELLFVGLDGDTMTRRWLTRSDSEIALAQAHVLSAADRIIGGFIGCAGRQLARRREADIIDLARQIGDPGSPKLRMQIRDIYTLSSPVPTHEYYLSKLGAIDGMETHQPQQFLLESCIERARRVGFDGVRVDIDESDRVLSRLFVDNGFEVIDRRKAPVSNVRYLNLVKPL